MAMKNRTEKKEEEKHDEDDHHKLDLRYLYDGYGNWRTDAFKLVRCIYIIYGKDVR